MHIISYSKCFVSLLSVAFASFAVFELMSWRKKKRISRREIHDVIMFSEPSVFIRSKFSRSAIPPSLDRILYYLNTSKQTLDICMYILTNQDIAHMIQKLSYRRVKVRLIIDADMTYCAGSVVRRLEKQGIEVRWMKSTYFMHHKYCLIDTSAEVESNDLVPIVMGGSLNWTNQASSGNWEDVFITSQQQIVQGYKEEFERLWLKFKPIVS